MYIPTKYSFGIFRGDFRQTGAPRNFLGNVFPRNSVGYFRRNSEEKRNSEELFPTTCFVVIIHDFKAGNILPDADMNLKVADSGMTRIAGVDQTEDNTKIIVGTYGYNMSP
uniref:Protein kinase domain-containing protein n=2 Tax=Brassica oleracea var. oleracea TaxID=109376 RepID=A0A0D2ZVA4_BRAOL